MTRLTRPKSPLFFTFGSKALRSKCHHVTSSTCSGCVQHPINIKSNTSLGEALAASLDKSNAVDLSRISAQASHLSLQNGNAPQFNWKLDCQLREDGCQPLSYPTTKSLGVPNAAQAWQETLPTCSKWPEPTAACSINPPSFLPRLGNRCLQTPCLGCHSLPCFCLLFSNTRRQHLMP